MHENSYFLPQVMQRYTINPLPAKGYLQNSERPGQEVNKEFITALLHAFEERTFCAADFEPFPIELIVDYIQRTHVFYLRKKLPEIEQSIALLSGLYTSNHPILTALQNFFHSYCQELTTHIQEEERKLLPYIVMLRQATHAPGCRSEYTIARRDYSIGRFLADHHDTEDELRDIRNTIRLYEPPVTNESLYRILLAQLQTFEQDLQVHADIEDKVLIPKAVKLETELNALLQQTSQWN